MPKGNEINEEINQLSEEVTRFGRVFGRFATKKAKDISRAVSGGISAITDRIESEIGKNEEGD